jgi:hypothetical protein
MALEQEIDGPIGNWPENTTRETSGRETWLRPNRRALWFGSVPPTLIFLLGAWVTFAAERPVAQWRWWIGGGLMLVGITLVGAMISQMRRPRIAYGDGKVQFYLRSTAPIAIPVEFVEAFFLGQGPLALPGAPPEGVTVNLVARISQRAPEWSEQEVKPAFGRWSEGYVTIRGTWCEPLNGELIRRLNRRLREVTEETAVKIANTAE